MAQDAAGWMLREREEEAEMPVTLVHSDMSRCACEVLWVEALVGGRSSFIALLLFVFVFVVLW